jgi:hypothetical protein
MRRDGLSATYQADYAVGSGSHAYGYVVRIGDYQFQAPMFRVPFAKLQG